MSDTNITTVTDIDESIKDITGESKTDTVIKTLLEKKHLAFISELTFEQIVEICKLKHIANKYGKNNFPNLNNKYPIEDNINTFIENFILYMCSYKRKRVAEFLDGLKTERERKERMPNMLSRVIGK